jgi:uncharacterized protein (DUF4415 family)
MNLVIFEFDITKTVRNVETPDDDNPAGTATDFAAGKPFAEAFPAKEHRKKNVTIRLDADLIDLLRAFGDGW